MDNSLIIKNMFMRDINRHINGVIKIGNEQDQYKQQELEEYVVTDELTKYFREFFSAYADTIGDVNNKEIGVWISGFYGSGKSHFMKILSYILENKSVGGKTPVQYFIDDHKIEDQLIIADMEKSASLSSDVMLFNIESLANTSHHDKDAILSVFLRAFNRQCGYDDINPVLADFEREIDEEGHYQAFKEKYEEIAGKSWISDRKKIKFRRKQFIKTVTELEFMAEEDANQLINDIHNRLPMSVSDFAKMLYAYCERKGKDHRVIFLVDEIGQYVADDSNLLINLQTIAEDFSTYCKGRAWIVVTSQQNIDEVTKVRGQDFSKIQARFNMRIALSSSDVDEVIQKRVLAKTNVAQTSLMAYYDGEESIIKNLLDFSNGTQFKRKYTDSENFANVYPFIPYQIDMLGYVLTAIRNNSSSGKHLSDGNRSMLALVQESAQTIENNELGVLVSFNKFYDCLEKWIDANYRQVIDSAKRNDNLEPFDVEVLKVLFMIKNVREIKAGIKDITTLMVNDVEVDRLDLTNKVNESLKRLIRETYVQKEGDEYSFLTNLEQDLNKQIKNERVDSSDIAVELKNIIFGDIYTASKFRYNSRYLFPFDKKIDDTPITQGNPIGLLIITPYNDHDYSTDELRPLSNQLNNVIFKLPPEMDFTEDLRSYIQTTNYLRKNSSTNDPVMQGLIAQKRQINSNMKTRIRDRIEESLKDAAVFISGNEAHIGNKNVVDRIDESLGQLVGQVYNKLSYMTTAPSKNDFMKIFNTPENLTLDDNLADGDNQLALDDMTDYIKNKNALAVQVSVKNLLDHFMVNPYGFVRDDVYWLILKLFHQKKVEFKLHGEVITEFDSKPNKIIASVTESKNNDKLIVSVKKSIPDRQIKTVNDLCSSLNSNHHRNSDSDSLMATAKNLFKDEINKFDTYTSKYNVESRLPGKEVIENFKHLLTQTISIKNPSDFFDSVDKHYDDFLDAIEDIEPIENFFKGTQYSIFKQALECRNKALKSNTYFDDDQLKVFIAKINDIVLNKNPYQKIKELPQYINDFSNRYNYILKSSITQSTQNIDQIEQSIIDEMGNDRDIRTKFMNSVTSDFTSFRSRLSRSTLLSEPRNIEGEALNKQTIYIQKINDEKQRILVKTTTDTDSAEPNVTVQPQRKTQTLYVDTLFNNADKIISNESELDLFLNNIRSKLEDELKKNHIVKIKVK